MITFDRHRNLNIRIIAESLTMDAHWDMDEWLNNLKILLNQFPPTCKLEEVIVTPKAIGFPE